MSRRGDKARKLPPVASFIERAVALGAKAAKVVDSATIATAPWVRLKCRYGCGCWGSSLCCPPHTPTPDETRKVIDSYAKAILFEAGGGETKKVAVALEREVFLEGYYKAFGMGAGPCTLCDECALEEGCRHADAARPAMEACGIDVLKTARSNGFEVNIARTRDDPHHYFGVVLVE